MTGQSGNLRILVLIALALLSATGVFASIHRYILVSPARRMTGDIQERAVEFQSTVHDTRQLMEFSLADPIVLSHETLVSKAADSIDLAWISVTAAIVALHIMNIYLILSGPVGQILTTLLFVLLLLLKFYDRNRLRNISMAVGTASYVFLAAIPMGVTLSGEISAAFTGGLRYSAQRRMESFQFDYTALVNEAAVLTPPEFRVGMITAAKGLNSSLAGASISWLLDLFLFPVLLTWLFYRLGILLANTFFGSFKMQKFGETLKKVFQRED